MLETSKRAFRLLLRHKKTFLLAYVFNLSVVLVVLIPFASSFEKSLGSGLHRTAMVGRIDYDWFSLIQDRGDELLKSFSPEVTGFGPFLRNLDDLVGGRLGELPPALLAAGLLYILLNSFLSGAAFGCFALDPNGVSWRDYFRRGGEFFGRFIRLTLLSLLSFALLHGWILNPIKDLVERITDGATADRSVFEWNFVAFLILLTLLSIVNMVFDYAKIVTATEDRTSVFLSFLAALTFCITYAVPAFALYLALGVLGAVWAIVGVILEQSVPQTAWTGVVVAATLQQICFLGRLAIRYFFYAAQTEFFLENENLYRREKESPSKAIPLAS